jgi:hypothetical protein
MKMGSKVSLLGGGVECTLRGVKVVEPKFFLHEDSLMREKVFQTTIPPSRGQFDVGKPTVKCPLKAVLHCFYLHYVRFDVGNPSRKCRFGVVSVMLCEKHDRNGVPTETGWFRDPLVSPVQDLLFHRVLPRTPQKGGSKTTSPGVVSVMLCEKHDRTTTET